MHPLSKLTVLLAALSLPGLAAEWSQFRGPGGSGVSDAKGTPLNWSDTSGIVWKTELPGPGTSSRAPLGNPAVGAPSHPAGTRFPTGDGPSRSVGA